MKEGWQYKKIKDIATVIGGTTPNTNVAEYWDGNLCWISPAELDGSHYLYDSRKKITEAAVKAKSLKLLPEGTVILSSRAPIGKVVINKVPTYCNQGFKCVVCGKEIYNEFLYWWFWGKTEYLNSLGTGATFKEISKKVVEEITIPVPPLSEQQSIVDYLDSAFAKIDAMKANAEKALNEAKALFQKAIEGAMKPKEGWAERRIKDVGSVIGGTTPNTNVTEYWNGTLCWISPAELDGSHYFYDSKKKITEAAVRAKSLKLLPVGTVILSSRAPIGKVVINKTPTYCNQGFKCVICGKEIYNEFLYWWFWGRTEYLNSLGTGVTFKEISKSVVEDIVIPVPPISEQQSIVNTLDSLKSKVDRLQENYDKISQECDALKQAILKQVFE